MSAPTAEHQRLIDSKERRADWKNWGPYVSDRAWGTVREDYSAAGDAWRSFPFEQARSRAFRWNEDGIAGFCNRFQNVCFTVALWNERDAILKERLFGLSGPQGNHGEDVKEVYFHLDSTPTHSWCRMLYRYPQVAFPYEELARVNAERGLDETEYELGDALADAFRDGRYFDVFVEYSKAGDRDVLCRITAVNQGPDTAPLHILPHVAFRNTWSWGHREKTARLTAHGDAGLVVEHHHLGGRRFWYARSGVGSPELLFAENETNHDRLYGNPNESEFAKDGIGDRVVDGRTEAVNPDRTGTKAAAWFRADVPPGGSFVVETRFSPEELTDPFADFDTVHETRRAEADEFYAAIQPDSLTDDERHVQRSAFAGLMWTKQFYHYSVELWMDGDPAQPTPPAGRGDVRNGHWRHLHNLDVISMPDKWEYPWYAAWDLAFHCLPIALVDPEWAKRQLVLMLREWYMHPNGQIPAYEWNFGDVNPPVHAWACWRVYQITRDVTGKADTAFLEEVFQKLLLNFTWWVNRKDSDGQNVFEGGFLGLDNIGVFDRSKPEEIGGRLEQADSTGWMAMYCLNMLVMALELARTNPPYEAVATKFFEHFVYIACAINRTDDGGLWDPKDGFYYDRVHLADDHNETLRIRSFVGLIPLFAVATLEREQIDRHPRFRRRMEWFVKYRRSMLENIASVETVGCEQRLLLSIVDRAKLERILPRMLDPTQFLSDYGLRSLSRQHRDNPFVLELNGNRHQVSYEPGESRSWLFGGNSNWRGPIWFPVNYLMIESLRTFHHFFDDSLQVELPRYSGNTGTLGDAADEIANRLVKLFTRETGRRPVLGDRDLFQTDERWRDHLPFYEYFHGDTGTGLGASHQTGWTALVATLLQQQGRRSNVEG